MKTPVLQTPRLILRPVILEDAPAIQKHFNNWQIIRYLSLQVPWPYPENGAETFLKDNVLPRIETGDTHCWVIVEQSGGEEAIGLIDFRKTKNNDGNRGFWIAQDYHGRGYMSEAVDAVNDFIFNALGLSSYEVCNVIGNIASRRVKEKTGAVFLGYGELEHHNGERKLERWEVTKESWLAARRIV